MKKLLLILPLLFWIGCEDESEEFSLVDEWIKCAYLSIDFDDGTTTSYEYIWDGLSVDIYRNGSLFESHLHNNYGSTLYREYDDGWKYYYEYDGWKITRSITINTNGDTTNDNSTYTWDGLTVTYQSGGLYYTKTHNSYGKTLLETVADSSGQEWYRYERTYKEDGRRLLEFKYYAWNELIQQRIYEWDGNTFEVTYYYSGYISSDKSTGKINEYGYTIKSEEYSCEDEDNCTLSYTVEYELDCDYFDPIPN
jgi:hypothetical protein